MRWLIALALIVVLPVEKTAATPRVILDPGHGGSNTGAAGIVEGVYEKRLTLALARDVARRLETRGIPVALTRTDDRYITLRERVRLANASGAALLISLHANASPTRAQRGFETWILSSEALEVDARALRSTNDGPTRPEVDEETAALLDDLTRGDAAVRAAFVADRIQKHLATVRPNDRGIKQGAMDVLMGPTMPAVLVEIGFIDHAAEGAELLRHDVRSAIADALADAIVDSLEMK